MVWLGQSDFKSIRLLFGMYLAKTHKAGVDGDIKILESEYICSNLSCTKDVRSVTLKICQQFLIVQYCSQACQTTHSTQHKRECKKLKNEYEDKKKYSVRPFEQIGLSVEYSAE